MRTATHVLLAISIAGIAWRAGSPIVGVALAAAIYVLGRVTHLVVAAGAVAMITSAQQFDPRSTLAVGVFVCLTVTYALVGARSD